MKTLVKICCLIIMPGVFSGLRAQQEVMISQYMFNPAYLNPGSAGMHPYTTATLLHRSQWVGLEGAPNTQIASIDGTLKKYRTGLGFVAVNDKIGVTRNTEMYALYSYHLQISENTELGMGINAGVLYYRAELSKLLVWDAGDQVFAGGDIRSQVIPNFGTGLYLKNKKFFAGLSAPNLLSYKPDTYFSAAMAGAPEIVRHFYALGGYNWDLNDNLTLKPSFLVKYVSGAPAEADFNVNVTMKKLVTVGIGFRTGDSFSGLVEMNLIKNLRLGYSYDYSFTELRTYSGGTHEIRLAYDLGKEAQKNSMPSFFGTN